MLDTQTKKRIDDCRDILVGKLPDPKAQIEQITIGLIYKFMDDMDKEAIELGGNVKFFADYKISNPEFPNDRKQDKLIEFSKYRWDKLFDSKVTATEMLQLYSEAITGMDKNPNIPPLFRDIFKNAYLPYRDPETLKMFLKTINEFEYSHSEKLGDAFEYLLSVMGSQGDAGQFRTPRHIIDFVTACVNPQKNETVLDPACGTAGFLLSAYKHILNQNTASTSLSRPGSALSPDDRKKLATNFVGYDISPDMVRLSLANMYLHGFATPLIHEYDSLSSEERWQETFDVILANPPFMTPKGGIRPHKRFGVQANKAEVLFTDYIAEHLNRNGRAGIVVPNGIVATSQTAYKQLRKMLVQDSLIAVISLPAGVFQPYSGVKTSVLILDKRLAKKSQHILFLKIENDGFDLGAQRREIDKNDLPMALQTLEAYKDCLSSDKAFEDLPSLATLVEKDTILSNKDIVLSADRYFEKAISQTEFDLVKLVDVCKVINGKAYKQDELLDKGKYLVLRVGNFFTNKSWYYSDLELPDDKYCDNGDLLYAWSASFGPKMWDGGKVIYHYHIWKMIPDETVILKKYLYLVLEKETERMKAENTNGSTMLHLTKEGIEQLEIPLPPLEIQQQIVAEIEGYQKIIDGAKQVVNNYKPTITINPDWEMVELGTLSTNISSGATPLGGKENYKDSGILFIRSQNVLWGETDFSDAVYITEDTHKNMKRSQVKFEDVFLNITGASIGRSAVMKDNTEANVNQHVVFIRTIKEKLNPYFLSTFLNSPYAQKIIKNAQTGAARQAINYEQIKELQIPLPTIEEQQTIVKAIEEEMQLVNANKRLIELFEQKIKTKIGEVWGVKNLKAV